MENLDISKQELNNLNENIINSGSEGKIYRATDHSLYKIFNNCFIYDIPNKMKKLEILNNIKIPFFRNPIKTISCDGNIIGYEEEYDMDDVTWWQLYLKSEEKIALLKDIKKKLIILEKEKIIYGDLKEDNILINRFTHEVSFCDVDNIQIDKYPIDLTLNVLDLYMNSINGIFGNEVHTFLHNLFTIREICYSNCESYNDVFKFLVNSSEIEFYMFNQKGKEVISELSNIEKVKKLSPVYLIDNLNNLS